MNDGYRANFLWPHEDGSIEEAGYEFINVRTEEYREHWWKILIIRIEANATPSQPEREALANELIAWAASDKALGIAEYEQTECCLFCDGLPDDGGPILHKPNCLHVRAQAATRPEER